MRVCAYLYIGSSKCSLCVPLPNCRAGTVQMDERRDRSNWSRFHGNMSFSSSGGVCSCRWREVPHRCAFQSYVWRPGLPFLHQSEARSGKSAGAGAQTPCGGRRVEIERADTERPLSTGVKLGSQPELKVGLYQPIDHIYLVPQAAFLTAHRPPSESHFQVTPNVKRLLSLFNLTKELGKTMAGERWRTLSMTHLIPEQSPMLAEESSTPTMCP